MGIDTYAALTERLSPEQIGERLRINCDVTNVHARRMRSPDHWAFEFELGRDRFFVLEAFLNGLAANDFPELGCNIQTLLSMEAGSVSEFVVRSTVDGCKGWLRLNNSTEWTTLAA